MRRIIPMLAALSVLTLGGCSGDKGKELFDTARFEEKQHNLEHATKLYKEIVRKYPGSEVAKMAEERLAALKEGKQ